MYHRIRKLRELTAKQDCVFPLSLQELIQLKTDSYIIDLVVTCEAVIDGACKWLELIIEGEAFVHVWDLLEVA